MPTLNIKDPDVHALAAELAQRTHRSMTEVVRESLRRSLDAERSRNTGHQRVIARVLDLARHASALPVLDHRSADEILGCDESGIPG